MLPSDLRGINVRDFLAQAVARHPEQLFLVTRDEEVTYAEFDHRASLAANVWHSLGVRKGDRVLFMLDNCADFLYAWFGLIELGAVMVAVNTRFKGPRRGTWPSTPSRRSRWSAPPTATWCAGSRGRCHRCAAS